MSSFARPSGRATDSLRVITLETGVAKYAEGSCLIKCGDTHVLCTASVEDKTPPWLKGKGQGWVTAEYAMLPRATHQRTDREVNKGHPSGRTQEIQRLIGRAMRAVVDLKALGEIQIRLDCDVLQADGGTRTASITGAYVAMHLACQHLMKIGMLTKMPLREPVAAVSCGLVGGTALLDLEYTEDCNAQADSNFVLTASGGLVEVQATAEQEAFAASQFAELMALAQKGTAELITLQKKALGID
ncbi:MAG TPA: ribonuclease PH [Alphaproteobacteria bacterium]